VTVTGQGAPAVTATSSITTPDGIQVAVQAQAKVYASAAPSPSPTALLAMDDKKKEEKSSSDLLAFGSDKDQRDIANASAPPGAPNALPPAAAKEPMAGAGGGSGWGSSPNRSSTPPAEQAPSPFDAAMAAYRAGRYEDATRGFDALSANDVSADLMAARSLRDGKGCSSAIARFDRVAQRAPSSPLGWDALLEGAQCYRLLGDFNAARGRLATLRKVDSHKDKAEAELAKMDSAYSASADSRRAGPQKPASKAAAAPPAQQAQPGPAATASAPVQKSDSL
jgi:hypothetical protein